jgi:hypothetical protein
MTFPSYESEISRAEGLRQADYAAATSDSDRKTALIKFQRRAITAASRHTDRASMYAFHREQLRQLGAEEGGKTYPFAGSPSTTASSSALTTLAAVTEVAGDTDAAAACTALSTLIGTIGLANADPYASTAVIEACIVSATAIAALQVVIDHAATEAAAVLTALRALATAAAPY